MKTQTKTTKFNCKNLKAYFINSTQKEIAIIDECMLFVNQLITITSTKDGDVIHYGCKNWYIIIDSNINLNIKLGVELSLSFTNEVNNIQYTGNALNHVNKLKGTGELKETTII